MPPADITGALVAAASRSVLASKQKRCRPARGHRKGYKKPSAVRPMSARRGPRARIGAAWSLVLCPLLMPTRTLADCRKIYIGADVRADIPEVRQETGGRS